MQNSFKKFRFGFRFLTAFWQKHKAVIAGGLVFGALFFFYAPRLGQFLLFNKVQRIGMVGKFTTSSLPLEIQELVGDGLTAVLPDGRVAPSLAASWEVHDDGREYLFTLADDVFWQTEEPVLAKDINYNFNDVAFAGTEEKKIKFELKESFVPFPVVVSRPIFKKGLVGTGEYKVKSIKRNGQIIEALTLKSITDGKKPLLVFRFYPTEGAARTGFKLGEVDVLREIASLGELRGWEQIEIKEEVRLNRFAGLFFNTDPKESQKFLDKSVRQALAYAVDKHWEPRALSSMNPDGWAYNANVKPYNFDLDRAKELLGEVTGESDEGVLDKIDLSTTPSLLAVGEEIKKNWEKLGVEVSLKTINSLDEPFEALLIFQEIPPDPDQYTLWHSTQPANISGYQSPKLDKLLEDGRKTLDQKERKKIYQDFQRFLVEDTPAVFLFHPVVYTVSRE